MAKLIFNDLPTEAQIDLVTDVDDDEEYLESLQNDCDYYLIGGCYYLDKHDEQVALKFTSPKWEEINWDDFRALLASEK